MGGTIVDLNLPRFCHSSEKSAGEKNFPQQLTARKGGSSSKGPAPLILGESSPVIPAKLVKKILKGEFVDMSDLLKDNLEAERCHNSQENGNSHSSFVQPP